MEYSKEMMNCSLSDNLTFQDENYNYTGSTQDINSSAYTAWHYWQDYWYPNVIRESYPVYIREQARDKGKQAFEIIKILKDKRFVNLEKVGDFIDLMDILIKIL